MDKYKLFCKILDETANAAAGLTAYESLPKKVDHCKIVTFDELKDYAKKKKKKN